MGLPLFVAPVESDLPSKSASKHGATSPARSSIRRSGWRDARAASARRSALRLYGAHGLPAAPEAQADSGDRPAYVRRNGLRLYGHGPREMLAAVSDPSTWPDVPLPPGFMGIDAGESGSRTTSRDIIQALENASQNSERRRERLQALLHASLRSTNRSQQDDDGAPEYLGWFSVEPEGPLPNPPRRTQLPRATRPHFVQATLETPRSSNEESSPGMSAREALAEANVEQSALPPAARRALRIQARVLRNHMTRLPQPQRRVDGLGDRDRSLSPEVWDTLLSTLTPDPQPPSASSSFVSAAASQTAATSSITTPSSGNTNTAPEPPCDSGCENSEGEDDDYDPGELDHGHSRRRTAEFELDGPSDGPFVRIVRRNERGASVRQADGPDAPVPYSRHASSEGAAGPAGGAIPLSRILHPTPPDGWVGRLSVGASDEEPTDEVAQQDREGSEGQIASGGDEDLSGMQRIIRSLSWRQDIPEEWWAEAGLRRTLPSDTELA